jgi:hypothetical protein
MEVNIIKMDQAVEKLLRVVQPVKDASKKRTSLDDSDKTVNGRYTALQVESRGR